MARAKPAGELAVLAGKDTYQVLSYLEVDGQQYVPQRDQLVTVDLTPDEAAPLLAWGAIQAAPVGGD